MIKYILLAVMIIVMIVPFGSTAISDDTIKPKKIPQKVQLKIVEDKPSCIENIQLQQKNIAQELKKIKNILKKQK